MTERMTFEQSDAWRPHLLGWSTDVLPFYQRMAAELRDGSVAVEVGVAHGRSILYMASQLVRLGKTRCQLWGVDPWPARDGDGWYGRSIYRIAREPASEVEMLRLVRATSLQGARLFAPRSLQFVFLDGLHDYESVREDIEAWSPKVERGGILAGHDYTRDSRRVARGGGFEQGDHPDVVRAVTDMFGSVEVDGPGSTVWMVRL